MELVINTFKKMLYRFSTKIVTLKLLMLIIWMTKEFWFIFQVLKGPFFYAFGDHGGIIVAVRQGEPTGEIW